MKKLLHAYKFSPGRLVLRVLLAGILSIIFGLIMIPFMVNFGKLSPEEAIKMESVNLWRIVFLYGFFTVIIIFITFWKKTFRFTAVILLLFWIIGTSFVVFTVRNILPANSGQSSQPPTFTGQEIFDAVNKYRKTNGVGEITLDDRLCNNLAQRELDIEAGTKEGIAHKNFDEWYKKYVPQNIYVSEDVANDISVEKIIKDWDGSPGHRLSILDPKAKIGCSYAANNWAVIEIGYVEYTTKKPVVSQTPTPNPNDPNRIIQCSISATCGGGIKDMTASECDKITCCQTSTGWIVTSKDNCNQTQKSAQTSTCISGWEQYRSDAIKMCDVSLSSGDYTTYQSCMNNAGQTANDGIAKCSQ